MDKVTTAGSRDEDLRSLRVRLTARYLEWLSKAETLMAVRLRRVSRFSSEAVIRRTLQRVVEISHESFLRECIQRGTAELTASLRVGGITYYPDGDFQPSLRVCVRESATFLKIWSYCLAKAFVSVFSTSGRPGPAALVADIGANVSSRGTDMRLSRFLRFGPVSALNGCTRWIFQSVRDFERSSPDSILYARIPVIHLVELNPVAWRDLPALIVSHLSYLFEYFAMVLSSRKLILLSRDFAFSAVYQYLDSRRLIEGVFLTDANYASQELFLTDLPNRRFKTHLLWHSQNVRPIRVLGEVAQLEYPHRRYMKMDETWFWTLSFGRWLEMHGNRAKRHVVGPIMFEIPGERSEVSPGAPFEICIFDVTPTHETWQKQNGWPYLYYNSDVSVRFLRDIVEAAHEVSGTKGRSIRLRLKHKRVYSPIHDDVYISYVKQLAESGVIELEEPDRNIFDLIREADLVLAIPFTSAALIAKFEGIETSFYDPTSEVVVTDDLHTADVKLIQGREALKEFVGAKVSESKRGFRQ